MEASASVREEPASEGERGEKKVRRQMFARLCDGGAPVSVCKDRQKKSARVTGWDFGRKVFL